MEDIDLKLLVSKLENSFDKTRVLQPCDLIAESSNSNNYIFEIKSARKDNIHIQLMRAVSQLYYYRYALKLKNHKLCILIGIKPNIKWQKYLESDRDILLIWKNKDGLYGGNKAKKEFQFLQNSLL